jgi:single-stranded-DNA-specific exonuclease
MTLWLEPARTLNPKLDELGLHPILIRALTRRGFDSPNSARAFLEPGLYPASPASELPDLDIALRRIWKALRKNERICIWGDFDVDGQTATAVLVQTLKAIGANLTYHIPVREKESHGIKIEYLKTEIDNGATLILTCDTGISEHQAVEYAKTRGVDLLITDHHDLPAGPLPTALAVINPKRLPETHPLATLAGVGVAYKLAEALLQNANTTLAPETLLDLAALGLVADVATLSGDTRYLVQRGLEQLRRNQRLGIQIMLELAGTNPQQLTESHIGFTLGPRLNALGRLGDANPAVELLTSADPVKTRILANQLEGLNSQRQLLTAQVTQAAEAQLKANPGLLAQAALILHHPTWPAGIIGIAASRLAERYHRPTLLLTGENPLRGSARSVEGVHISEAIRACQGLLLGFGGHPMAAGLSLSAENLPALRKQLARAIETQLGTNARPEAELHIDEFLRFNELSLDLAGKIELLAPFGAGNPTLTLATRNLTLKSAQRIGKTREHAKWTVSDEDGNRQNILWWGGADEPQPEGRFDLAYSLRTSDFKGQKQLALELIDIRALPDEKPVEIKDARPIEKIDLRNADNPLEQLDAERQRKNTIVFAEGKDKKTLSGLGRHELGPAETLIVWTAPPNPRIYQSLLETVCPRRLVFFCQPPGDDSPAAFLTRLAGLIKFIITQREGKTTLTELAAACAQGEESIRVGIEWLKASGQVTGEADVSGLCLSQANAPVDDSARARWMSQLIRLLDESRAYRKFLHTAAH